EADVWKFSTIAVVIAAVFMIYPIFYSLIISLHKTQGLKSVFVGFGNVKRLFQDTVFWKALGNNFIFLLFQVPLMLILGLLFATLLNDKKLHLRGFFRTALFLPCVTSLVAYSVLFRMMFQLDGVVNDLLLALHLVAAPINWLNDPFWAKVLIVLALCWRWTGYNMMFFIAGLQNVSGDTLEAAEIDGANGWQKFFFVTVPQLKSVILFTTIMSTIGTVQLFDEVVNLTGGGPANATATASQLIYNHSFVYTSNFGYSAMLSWVLVIIVAALSFVQFKVAGDKE
ncbi:MAG: sugar ABC transporter permease, partial [Ruthenibacterium sp.]